MSQSDQNQQNPPPNDKKPSTDSAAELARLLEKKFGITDAVEKPESQQFTREVGSTLREELDDTTFIDLEEYSKGRSRHIENKYGLKPLSDIIAPKSEEEQKKELEDYLRRNKMLPGSIMKNVSNKIAKTTDSLNKQIQEVKEIENSYPQIYKWFEDVPGYRPEINIGEKWANQITEQVKNEAELSRARRRGGHIYQAWKKGKIGIDKYLILFGVFGAALLPIYIYYRNKQYKEFVMAERGIKPGEEVDLENGKWDIDDISNHRRFFVDREERQKSMEKLAVKKEIKRLEQELYPRTNY